jgi:hypothetical protein
MNFLFIALIPVFITACGSEPRDVVKLKNIDSTVDKGYEPVEIETNSNSILESDEELQPLTNTVELEKKNTACVQGQIKKSKPSKYFLPYSSELMIQNKELRIEMASLSYSEALQSFQTRFSIESSTLQKRKVFVNDHSTMIFFFQMADSLLKAQLCINIGSRNLSLMENVKSCLIIHEINFEKNEDGLILKSIGKKWVNSGLDKRTDLASIQNNEVVFRSEICEIK